MLLISFLQNEIKGKIPEDLFQEIQSKHEKDLSLMNERLRYAEEIAQKRTRDIDSLREMLKESETQLSQTKIELKEIQNQQGDHRLIITPLELNVKRLELQLDSQNKHAAWLQTTIDEKMEEIRSLRETQVKEKLDLTSQINSLQQELESKRRSAELNQKELIGLKNQLEKTSQDLANTKEELDRVSEDRAKDIEIRRKLTEKYKKWNDDQQKEIIGLRKELKDREEAVDTLTKQWASERKEIIQAAEEALKEAEEKNTMLVKNLEENLSNATQEIQRLQGVLDRARTDPFSVLTGTASSNSAALASLSMTAADVELARKGLSMAQIYGRLVEEGELRRKAEHDLSIAKEQMKQILREIEIKAPEIKQMQDDYEKAITASEILSDRLNGVMAENSKLYEQDSQKDIMLRKLQHEREVLQQECSDLAKQVQSLLLSNQQQKQTHSFMSATTPERVVNTTSRSTPGSSGFDAQSVITDNLVSFTNIEELQAQNQKLLRTIRELAKDRENDLAKKDSESQAATQEGLKKALEEVKQLKEGRVRMQDMVSAVVAQRDMYRALLTQVDSKHSAASSSSMLSHQQQQISVVVVGDKSNSVLDSSMHHDSTTTNTNTVDYYTLYLEKKKESEVFRQQVLDFNAKSAKLLDETKEALSKARQDEATAKQEVRFEKSRYEQLLVHLNDSKEECSRAQKSLEALRNQLHQQISISEDREKRISELSIKLASMENKNRDLESSKTLLEGQITALKSLSEDLKSQRDSQRKLNDSLEALEASRRSDLLVKIEDMTKEIERLQSLLKDANSALKETRHVQLQDVSSSHAELKSLHVEVSKTKSELSNMKEQVLVLSSQLEAAKSRETLLSTQLEKANAISASVRDLRRNAGLPGTVPNHEEEPAFVQLREELRFTKESLTQKERDVETYRTIASAHEATLKELTEKYEALTNSQSSLLNENSKLKKDIENSSLHVKELQSKANQTLAQTKELLDAAVSRALKAENDLSGFERKISALESDNKALSDTAREASANYSRELQLHAADSALLAETRNRLNALLEELNDSKTKLAIANERNSSLESSIETEKAQFEKRCNDLMMQLHDASRQNELLGEQVQDLHEKMRISSYSSSLNISNNNNNNTTGDGITSSDEIKRMREEIQRLSELQNLLMKQRDQITLEKEDVELDLMRNKQQMLFMQRELDQIKERINNELGSNQNDTKALSESEHAKLIELVRENGLLRSMNAMLADEKAKLETQLDQSKVKIVTLSDDLASLRVREEGYSASNAQILAEKASLVKECSLLQERYNSILSQFGEKVSSETHQQTLKELEETKASLEALQKQLKELSDKVQSLESANALVTEQRKKQTDIAKRFKEDMLNAQKKSAELSSQLEKSQEELKKLQTQNSDMRSRIEKLSSVVKHEQTQQQTLVENEIKAPSDTTAIIPAAPVVVTPVVNTTESVLVESTVAIEDESRSTKKQRLSPSAKPFIPSAFMEDSNSNNSTPMLLDAGLPSETVPIVEATNSLISS